MDGFRIPIGEWGKSLVDWIRDNLDWATDAISVFVGFLAEGLASILMAPPAPVMILIFALIAWLVRSWQLAVGTVVMFVIILGVGQWETSMQTLALVLIATLVTVAIAVPLGIWAARNDTVSTIVKPVLDLMQTMPSLVYLIPVIIFFSLGFVPGVIATVIFSLPLASGSPSWASAASTPRRSRRVTRSVPRRGRSCAASSCPWRCRPSWPVSTR